MSTSLIFIESKVRISISVILGITTYQYPQTVLYDKSNREQAPSQKKTPAKKVHNIIGGLLETMHIKKE